MGNIKLFYKYLGTKLAFVERPTIHFISSLWNRGRHLSELVDNLNEIYKVNPNFEFHLCDYNSTDVDVEHELKRLLCRYHLVRLDEKFNYGKGLNIGIRSVPGTDIVVSTAMDIRLPDNIIEKIHAYTKRGETFFSPECGIEDKQGKLVFRHGGCGFISVYKSDYSKTGGFEEKTTWGEEDTNFALALKNDARLKTIRYRARDIISKWHERDFSTTWYRDSDIAKAEMYIRKWWKGSLVNIE